MYDCIPNYDTCFEIDFFFSDPSVSGDLWFEFSPVGTGAGTTWRFRGGEDEEHFFYCIEDGEIGTVPTRTPTASFVPTPRPSPRPTVDPSPRPTLGPTSMPSPRPTVDPSPKPTREPTFRPVPRPTHEPTDEVRILCADSTSWYYEKKGKTCADYIAKKAKHCDKEDEFGVTAEVACPVVCGQCEPVCADSTSWYYLNKKSKERDCEYVAKDADSRCSEKDELKVKAEDACPMACDAC